MSSKRREHVYDQKPYTKDPALEAANARLRKFQNSMWFGIVCLGGLVLLVGIARGWF